MHRPRSPFVFHADAFVPRCRHACPWPSWPAGATAISGTVLQGSFSLNVLSWCASVLTREGVALLSLSLPVSTSSILYSGQQAICGMLLQNCYPLQPEFCLSRGRSAIPPVCFLMSKGRKEKRGKQLAASQSCFTWLRALLSRIFCWLRPFTDSRALRPRTRTRDLLLSNKTESLCT